MKPPTTFCNWAVLCYPKDMENNHYVQMCEMNAYYFQDWKVDTLNTGARVTGGEYPVSGDAVSIIREAQRIGEPELAAVIINERYNRIGAAV